MDVHPLIRHEPDPDHPGWWTWDVAAEPTERFNATIGKLLVRADGPGRATCRMFPEERHSNLGDMVHGGAILTFIDMAFFAGGRLAGAERDPRGDARSARVRFLSPGRIGVPLDAEVELLRETKRLAFFAGKVVQEGELVAAFTGALRKSSRGRMTALAERYRALVAAGELQPDADQAHAVAVLDALAAELAELPQKGSLVWRVSAGAAKPPPAASICGAGSGAASRC